MSNKFKHTIQIPDLCLQHHPVDPCIKMYNGIGLETARGSGTNGYVQRNASFVRAKRDRVDYKTEEQIAKAEALTRREPNQGIIDHERKRRLEVRIRLLTFF